MIYSETIQIVYSEVIDNPIFSEEDQDYRTVADVLRITEQIEIRLTESGQYRTLES